MTFATDVESGVTAVINTAWDARVGTVVPTTDTVKLSDGAVNINATYVYADMADSTGLAQKVEDPVAAKVIRSYLNAATRILKHYGGEIRSFDGDRVMAIFIGDYKNNDAVKAAFAINWAVVKVINPKLDAKWPASLARWSMKHGIGIATGAAMVVRGGVRNSNDLVSIGSAPNVAAKLSERRTRTIYITREVHNVLSEAQLRRSDGSDRWSEQFSETIGGATVRFRGSNAWRRP